MRLLTFDEHGEIVLSKWFDEADIPPYAILSHTWGPDSEELTLQDLKTGQAKAKVGYAKLTFCAERTRHEKLQFFWIDSCCMDKTNSAELAQSIVSMFRWYQNAQKCYVYLSDVSADSKTATIADWEPEFRKSRWFSRGWTLQELIAPTVVEFYTREGAFLGDKDGLGVLIRSITGLAQPVLRGVRLEDIPPNERLQWVAQRQTRLPEDKVYCLFGIFGVVLPPIYGEGQESAFSRLQKAINEKWNQLDPRLMSQDQDSSRRLTTRFGEIPTIVPSSQLLRDLILDSLGFAESETRAANVTEAQRATCEWFLDHPMVVAWNSQDANAQGSENSVLWVSGKPGAGKSTLMKFALEHAKEQATAQDITLAFFFNARGEKLEKSTTGMYRSLIVQLAHAAAELAAVLERWGTPPATWTVGALQKLFHSLIRDIAAKRVCCFIDALDEGEEEEIRDMLMFFEEICEDLVSHKERLRICFASRHYPTLTIRTQARLNLDNEPGHEQDIEKYISRKLRVSHDARGGELRREIQSKANGVFMWTVLVVELLNKELVRGRLFAIRNRLQQIPAELSDVFQMILSRDEANIDDLLLCLQWILYAERPLAITEFFFAMEAGLAPSYDPSWSPSLWDKNSVSPEDMSRFMHSSSKGLAELSALQTVQFIHESVPDFLMKQDGLVNLLPRSPGGLDIAISSHLRLLECCRRYLDIYLPNLPISTFYDAAAARDVTLENAPLIGYASWDILWHANKVAATVSMRDFLTPSFVEKIFHVAGLIGSSSCRPPPVGFEAYAEMIYLLAEEDLANLILVLGTTGLGPRRGKQLFHYPLLAAFAYGNENATRVLLRNETAATVECILRDSGFGCASNATWRPVPTAAPQGPDDDIRDLSFDHDPTRRVVFDETPLDWASRLSCPALCQWLKQNSAQWEADYASLHPRIDETAVGAQEGVMRRARSCDSALETYAKTPSVTDWLDLPTPDVDRDMAVLSEWDEDFGWLQVKTRLTR